MSGSTTLRAALAACVLLCFTLGCATQVAMRAGSFHVAVGTTLADPRVSEKLISIGPEGEETQIGADKYAASERFLEMVEATLPEIVESAVRAAIISMGIGAVGGALDGLSDSDDVISEVVEEGVQ